MSKNPLERLRELDDTLVNPDLVFQLVMQLFEKAPDATIVTETSTGKIVLVNQQAEFMFGYHRSEMIDQVVELLMPENLRPRHIDNRAIYAKDPHLRPMGIGLPLKGRNKDGLEFSIEINLSPVVTRHGSFTIATIRRRNEA